MELRVERFPTTSVLHFCASEEEVCDSGYSLVVKDEVLANEVSTAEAPVSWEANADDFPITPVEFFVDGHFRGDAFLLEVNREEPFTELGWMPIPSEADDGSKAIGTSSSSDL